MRSANAHDLSCGGLKRTDIWLLVGLLLGWCWLSFHAIMSAAQIWYVSEIFSHGFFILPGAIFLMWRDRQKITWGDINPNLWVLIFLVPVLILGLFGHVGDIQVFEHFSAFASFSLLAWLVLGNTFALRFWFPLLFVLFSVPLGEEMVPFLQSLTADMSVKVLSMTGIPVYSSGLYIEIPNGKFVVAEACSGIRFFIGSLVFGAIYAHLTYQRLSFKFVFMVIAIFVPVFANALRVTGIVLAGYYSDMTVAVGADHLVYGWVFFAIVLVFLIILGGGIKRFERHVPATNYANQPDLRNPRKFRRAVVVSICILSIFGFWRWSVGNAPTAAPVLVNFDGFSSELVQDYSSGWKPDVTGSDVSYSGKMRRNNEIDVALHWFLSDREGHELVARTNRWYHIDDWSLKGRGSITTDSGVELELIHIVSSGGEERLVLGGYIVDATINANRGLVKLKQTWDRLFGGQGEAGLLLVSSGIHGGVSDEEARLLLAFEHLSGLASSRKP